MKIRFIFIFWTLILLSSCKDPKPSPTPVVENAQTDTIKILVAEDGFYQLTQATLQENDITFTNFGTIPFQLTQNGEPVAYYLTENSLIFYGQASDNRYAVNRPYILHTGEDIAGIQMAQTPVTTDTTPPLTNLPNTIHFEQDLTYRSQARTREFSELVPWFWEVIRVESQATVNVQLPAQTDGSGTITLQLWGATTVADTENDHDIDLIINGQNIGTIVGDGETVYSNTLQIPAGVLQAGQNSIILDNTPAGATFLDINYLDWIEISYNAPLQADQDVIWANAGISGQATLSKFSTRPHLFDIANPTQPRYLTDWEYENETATINITPDMKLAGIATNGYHTPVAILPVRNGNWQDPKHQADLIIIAHDPLIPALAPLVEARQADGLTAVVVPAIEIYDEFGYGVETPASITTFLQHAATEWQQPAPQYLLLVGDTTYDFHNNLNLNPENSLPSPIVQVQFSGETVSDTRIVDLDGDFAPDMAVGRWPLSTPDEVANLVERTLDYEQNPVSNRALFTAERFDNDHETMEFTSFTENLIEQSNVPAEQVKKLYGTPAHEVAENWSDGAWLVTFTGHGGADLWGNDDILTVEAFESISTDSKPIVLQFTCLTGFFHDPNISSITETMLRDDDGPVILVGATSLTLSNNQSPFAVNLLRAIQDPTIERFGDAFQFAKASLSVENLGMREVSDTFLLFGDPSARINRPAGTQLDAGN